MGDTSLWDFLLFLESSLPLLSASLVNLKVSVESCARRMVPLEDGRTV